MQGVLDGALRAEANLSPTELFDLLDDDGGGSISFLEYAGHIHKRLRLSVGRPVRSARSARPAKPSLRGMQVPVDTLRKLTRTFGGFTGRGGGLLVTGAEFEERLVLVAPERSPEAADLYREVLNRVNGTVNLLKLLRELVFPGADPGELVSLATEVWPVFSGGLRHGSEQSLAVVYDLFADGRDRDGLLLGRRGLVSALKALGYSGSKARMLSAVALAESPGAASGLRFRELFRWYGRELAFQGRRRSVEERRRAQPADIVAWMRRNAERAKCEAAERCSSRSLPVSGRRPEPPAVHRCEAIVSS